jgi:hypothetical protein
MDRIVYFVVLTIPWNLILLLDEAKNVLYEGAIENCTFGEHLAALAK